jgi:hypothetical protein
LRNLADGNFASKFWSKLAENQWVCWNFHGITIRPTHYVIRSGSLKSWILESSLDEETWTEIDQHTEYAGLAGKLVRSGVFPLSQPGECHFIRLTQTGKNHNGTYKLALFAFEVFGTLLDERE